MDSLKSTTIHRSGMMLLCFIFLSNTILCFSSQGESYPIFHCPKCLSMKQVEAMSCRQNQQGMESLRCMHSVVCQQLVSNWRTIWDIPRLDQTVESFKFFSCPEIKVKKLRHDSLFLCATQSSGEISLLFTVTKRQKTRCASPKCKCFKMYQKARLDREAGEDESDVDDDWPSSEDEAESQRPQHYQDDLPEHQHRYGYNHETIRYPIYDDPEVHSSWLKRLNGEYNFPERIVPEYDAHYKCKAHGNAYDPDDTNLVEQSKNLVVYKENIDAIYPTKTMARPTVGNCKCMLQPSGHAYLLWHVGNGKMIDMLVPYKYMHLCRSAGISMHALFQ